MYSAKFSFSSLFPSFQEISRESCLPGRAWTPSGIDSGVILISVKTHLYGPFTPLLSLPLTPFNSPSPMSLSASILAPSNISADSTIFIERLCKESKATRAVAIIDMAMRTSKRVNPLFLTYLKSLPQCRDYNRVSLTFTSTFQLYFGFIPESGWKKGYGGHTLAYLFLPYHNLFY